MAIFVSRLRGGAQGDPGVQEEARPPPRERTYKINLEAIPRGLLVRRFSGAQGLYMALEGLSRFLRAKGLIRPLPAL